MPFNQAVLGRSFPAVSNVLDFGDASIPPSEDAASLAGVTASFMEDVHL